MNISFSDFWTGFEWNNNFFADLIKSMYPNYNIIPFSNDSTDILIYSCFGTHHHHADRKKVKKIFYTGENKRPNYSECDYSFTFDFDDYGGKNIRIPLWLMQIDWFNKKNYGNPQFVIPQSELRSNVFSKKPKTKFCSIVFNSLIPNRVEILEKLSKYKKIDCYGVPFGNHFYGEDVKYRIISDYKFNICFENSLFPGYYTEKLIHAKTAGCLPLYSADKNCEKDFNSESFLNLSNFKNMDAFIEKIIELDNDEKEYTNIASKYLFEGKEPSLETIKYELRKII